MSVLLNVSTCVIFLHLVFVDLSQFHLGVSSLNKPSMSAWLIVLIVKVVLVIIDYTRVQFAFIELLIV